VREAQGKLRKVKVKSFHRFLHLLVAYNTLQTKYKIINFPQFGECCEFREFSECEYSPKRPLSEIRETGQTRDIRRAVLRVLARLADIRQTVLRGLARLANIRQAVLRGLARLAKGEFGKCYANLANLASVG
jgi:hypothetical protein